MFFKISKLFTEFLKYQNHVQLEISGNDDHMECEISIIQRFDPLTFFIS